MKHKQRGRRCSEAIVGGDGGGGVSGMMLCPGGGGPGRCGNDGPERAPAQRVFAQVAQVAGLQPPIPISVVSVQRQNGGDSKEEGQPSDIPARPPPKPPTQSQSQTPPAMIDHHYRCSPVSFSWQRLPIIQSQSTTTSITVSTTWCQLPLIRASSAAGLRAFLNLAMPPPSSSSSLLAFPPDDLACSRTS